MQQHQHHHFAGAACAAAAFEEYQRAQTTRPLYVHGDAGSVLAELPERGVDCVLTSPPYWSHRRYKSQGLGNESRWQDYVANLLDICAAVGRVLKDTGSFWLNLGDAYRNKRLLGLPWRVALALCDDEGWTLRNDVIWNKLKGGPDNSRDKLRNVPEHLFHFVKQPRDYFYDVDAIRAAPREAKVENGAVVSATGVRGVRYRRQIELSTQLTPAQKEDAFAALEEMLAEVRAGKLADFRMIIRGQQRTTHSDSEQVSGRARELNKRGFYFLRYHPDGAKPRDVWEIMPEDTHKRGGSGHFAPFPEDLCKLPILATCPADGVVLDPFCGTGTTNLVAYQHGRKSVGIDVTVDYLQSAAERTGRHPPKETTA